MFCDCRELFLICAYCESWTVCFDICCLEKQFEPDTALRWVNEFRLLSESRLLGLFQKTYSIRALDFGLFSSGKSER